MFFTEGLADGLDMESDSGDGLAKGVEVEAVEEGGLSRRVEAEEEDVAVLVAAVMWESVM